MYQLVFRGECVSGVDEATARERVKALFKASEAQVEKMFSGGRVVIRNKLDGLTAQKYQGVLKQKGMICHIESMPGQASDDDAPATAVDEAPGSRETPQNEPARESGGGGVAVEPGDRPPLAGEKVDAILAGSGLSLGRPGEQLGESREEEAPVFEHIDSWTLAQPGEPLVESRDEASPAMPDISHLSLADDNNVSGS